MKVTFSHKNPADMELTISFTMPLSQWRSVSSEILHGGGWSDTSGGESPGVALRREIQEVISKTDKTLVNAAKTSVKDDK